MKRENLLTISQFAEIAGVSAQRLRRYERAGILVPDRIDDDTGYRYYRPGQLNRAVIVRLLREVGVPLREIAKSAAADDPESLRELLRYHRTQLARMQFEMQGMLALVDQGLRSPDALLSTAVTSAVLRPIPVVSRRVTLRPLPASADRTDLVGEIDAFLTPALEELTEILQMSDIEPAGREIMLFHNPLDWRDGLDCELCLPMSGAISSERPECWVLPGGLGAQVTTHGMWYGHHIGMSALLAWADDHGFDTAGPLRERYLVDGRDTADTRDFATQSTWLLADRRDRS